ncbi:MAG TPA: RHS repeat-associated core domain-containing protein [Anaerolineaceae bacterium]
MDARSFNLPDGGWTVLYGPSFSGAITVTTRTGEGSVGDLLSSPATALLFPAMLDLASPQTKSVPTNQQAYVFQDSQAYTFAPGINPNGQTFQVNVAPSGAYTARSIHFALEASPPVFGAVNLDASGTHYGSVIGAGTGSITLSFTVSDPDAANGRSLVASVLCPAAYGSPAQQAAFAAPAYTCSYPLATPTPGITELAFIARDNFGNTNTQTYTVTYDLDAPVLTLDVSDQPGITYFAAWQTVDASPITSFTAKQVSGADCSSAGTEITLPGDQTRLQLANNGKRFCLKATDGFGNTSDWESFLPGAETSETLTYSFGGVTAVERIGAGQTQTVYVFADRLSSASLVTTTQGEKIADQRYLPFGEERWNAVDLPNDRGYTGQRNEPGFGLLDYNARFYSAYLGRFVSADTLVPDPADAKAFDRYAYVNNSPILFNDPSGHDANMCGDNWECYAEYDKRMGSSKALNSETSFPMGGAILRKRATESYGQQGEGSWTGFESSGENYELKVNGKGRTIAGNSRLPGQYGLPDVLNFFGNLGYYSIPDDWMFKLGSKADVSGKIYVQPNKFGLIVSRAEIVNYTNESIMIGSILLKTENLNGYGEKKKIYIYDWRRGGWSTEGYGTASPYGTADVNTYPRYLIFPNQKFTIEIAISNTSRYGQLRKEWRFNPK